MGSSSVRISGSLLLASGLVLGLTAGARAHDEGPDLEPLVTYVGTQIPATVDGDSKVHRAFVSLGRTLGRTDVKPLADPIKKLQAVSRACAKALSTDAELRSRLNDAVAESDESLAVWPAEIESLVDQLSDVRDRGRVEKKAVAARNAHLGGRDLGDTGDEPGQLKAFHKAALGFAAAEALAEKLLDRQGGPVGPNLTAVPGDIYTVAGTGTGGFNGDGRSARRSTLYWVEKVRLGPDGLLYILDWNNHMFRRREANGMLTRLAGSGVPGDSEGPALTTQLNHPSAIDFLPDGRILIAAWHNHKVKVYDPTGPSPVVYTIVGGPAGNSGDGGPATDARFNLVPGVLLLPDGDILVTDASNQVVRKVSLGTAPVSDTNVAGTVVTTGTVTRVFGTGTAGWSGDGGQAGAAQLSFSKAQNAESDGRMTLGADGSVYIVNGVAHVIRKVAMDGTITTVAGNGTAGFSGDGGPATAAQLDFPADVVVALDGTLFISDQFNHCVRKVDAGGTITTVAGVPTVPGYDGDEAPGTAAHLNRPSGLELDVYGNLYICDKNNSVVRVLASAAPGPVVLPRAPYRLPGVSRGAPPARGASGAIATFAGSGTAAFSGDGLLARETDFYWPQDCAVNPATGLLYIVDWNNHRIRRVEDDGTVQTVAGVGQLGDTNGPALEVRMNHPTDVTFHPLTGELYFAGWHVDKVKRIVASTNAVEAVNKFDGKRAFSGDGGPVSNAELNLPSSVKFDAAGNMYIGDEGNRRVRKVDVATGFISTLAGDGTSGFQGDGGPAINARFNLPVGQSAQPAGRVCVDPTNGYLYVADTDNHRVRRIDLVALTIDTVAGEGTAAYAGDGGQATAASLSSPTDVDCDSAGNLYICDRDNHAVRKVTLATGIITTVAGTGGSPGYSGNGGAATAAKLNFPSGIFVDRSTGRLFITDTINSVIRVVWE